jgi:cation transport regulator ChaC
MPLYFAYGSNMDRAAMTERCPASKAIGTGRLMRHSFMIFSGGYASVTRNPVGTTWGLLWDLSLSDMPALDRYESLSTGLYTKVIQPIVTEHGARRAIVYVGRDAEAGIPKPGYVEGIVEAAEAIGLPANYLAELNAWNPSASGRAVARPAVRPLWAAPSSTLRRSG